MVTSNSVFISYRRDLGFAWARLVWENLNDHGIDAFLDLESLREAGHFDTKVLHQIEGRPYFVPVLVHGSLERCTQPTDWLRREIEHAVETERAIVPLVGPHFDFAEIDRCLPDPAASVLRSSNGIGLVAEYFGEAMTRLRDERLQPIDLPVRALSPADQQFAADAHQRASRTGGPGPGASTETDATTAEDRPTARLPPPVAPTAGSDRPPKRTVMGRARAVVAVAAGAAVLGVGAFATAAVLTTDDEPQDAEGKAAVDTAVETAAPTAATTTPTTMTPTTDGPTTSTTPLPTTTVPEPLPLLRPDQWLDVGWSVVSDDERHELILVDEGQLVLVTDGEEQLRVPEVADEPDAASDREISYRAYMQDDGNFVLYRTDRVDPSYSVGIWDTRTRGADTELRVVDVAGVGAFRVEGDGRVLWACPGDCPEAREDDDPEPTPTDPPTVTPGTTSPTTTERPTTTESTTTSVPMTDPAPPPTVPPPRQTLAPIGPAAP